MKLRKPLMLTTLIYLIVSGYGELKAQSNFIKVDNFDKVVVSPHVQVILQEGETESVTIENHGVDEEKINVRVDGKTLSIYLDQAKVYTRSYKTYENGRKRKNPIYRGTLVTAHITYKDLKKLEVRGEETANCISPIIADAFTLILYGESRVTLTSVESERMKILMFGENELEIQEGSINRQKINSYGENKLKAAGVNSRITKINTFGESKFKLNVLDNLRVTAFGESDINYTGDAYLNKGIVIGENKIYQNSY
ncbi:hypothetical protein BH23BAC1_BH23BAC1_38760 [soil metagenome]